MKLAPDLPCFDASTSGGAGVQANWFAGSAVTAGYGGGAPGFENELAFAAIGAPASDSVGQSGMVMVRTIGPQTGEFGSSTYMDQDIYAPSTTTAHQFGRAVLATDIQECVSGLPGSGCGHELLIANPDVGAHTTPGEVHLYKYDVHTPFAWQHVFAPPAGTPNGAEYGLAMEAPRSPVDELFPWEQAPDAPPWVAISAPGVDKVFVYAVSPAAMPPLTLVQTLTGADPGRRFGWALAAGDYNGDGISDLAVGAPKAYGTAWEGRVYVYPGLPAAGPLGVTATVLDGFPLTGTSSGGVQKEDFGAAMVSAHMAAGPRDTLVVGAPRLTASGDPTAGGLCAFRFDTCGSPGCAPVIAKTECAPNPWAATTVADGERFGYSMTAANFFAVDGERRDHTEESMFEEVAVGRPGAIGKEGRVNVYFSIDGLPVVSSVHQVELTEWGTPAANAGFGGAVTQLVAQTNPWADLVVGAPGSKVGATAYGSYSLSQAIAPPVCATGDYLFTDLWGSHVSVNVATNGAGAVLTFRDPYRSQLVDSSGSSAGCEFGMLGAPPDHTSEFSIPAGFEVPLGGALACTGSTTFPAFDAVPLLKAIATAGTSDPVAVALIESGIDAFVTFNGPQTAVPTVTVDTSVLPAELPLDLDLSGIDWAQIEADYPVIDATCRPESLPWTGTFESGVCDG